MRYSKSFIKTTKDVDNDVILVSHNLLIRGSFISKSGSGLYALLPLGIRVRNKITNIVKKHMDKSGSNQVELPFVTSASLWEESGRVEKYGKELLKFNDRKSFTYVLSPTNEEAMVDIVRGRVKSYKDLPFSLYQIATKFRDEIRPRYGLLRSREFLMKDAYSFHSSAKSLSEEFNLMHQTYSNILEELGLDYRAVDAHSGAIGGNSSKEFMVFANSGEDTIVVCNSCSYASNIEVAQSVINLPANNLNYKVDELIETKDLKTITDICKFLSIRPSETIKAIAKNITYSDKSSEIVIFFLSGEDNLVEEKVEKELNSALIDDNLDDCGLELGYIGVSSELCSNYKTIFDNRLKNGGKFITGANKRDYHTCIDLSKFTDLHFSDLREVKEGEPCKCGGTLKFKKAMEVGHIFKLDTTYSRALNATYLDEFGKQQYFIMGCYGFGISRIIAAYLEQKGSIENGCSWNRALSPYNVYIVNSNIKNEVITKYSEELHTALTQKGIDTLLDDRKDRFGVKIKDAELIGCYITIIVGNAFCDSNEIEFRVNGTKNMINSKDTIDKIEELMHA